MINFHKTGNSNNYNRRRYKTDILVVDDSATMRKIVSRSLLKAGLSVGEVYEASDGVEAMEIIKSGKDIQLILSDVNMPNMDGVEFVKHARAAGCTIPIVMITTENENVLDQAFSYGALTSIKKPFTPEHLSEKLGNLF